MAQPYARPELPVIEELERVATGVEEELDEWRRRCQRAETSATDASTVRVEQRDATLVAARERIGALEQENAVLRGRIATARDQLEALKSRLRFIEDRPAGDLA